MHQINRRTSCTLLNANYSDQVEHVGGPGGTRTQYKWKENKSRGSIKLSQFNIHEPLLSSLLKAEAEKLEGKKE
ncbi:hypothetical protein L6164_009694 [Bauhinia variegata]|uniref:Uncharacterized protein n=1 Tax=Bauhinia variegata TaxID=167791 RepID=A0ACB9PJU9_BAUVA|nr:hypothetical protein L6164_009694 [Bauhinia variegata]